MKKYSNELYNFLKRIKSNLIIQSQIGHLNHFDLFKKSVNEVYKIQQIKSFVINDITHSSLFPYRIALVSKEINVCFIEIDSNYLFSAIYHLSNSDPFNDLADLFDDLNRDEDGEITVDLSDESTEQTRLSNKHVCNNHEYIDMFFTRRCKHCGKEE